MKLENGHVVRLKNNPVSQGNVRFVTDGVARVMWGNLAKRDSDVPCEHLEVQIREGRRLIWVSGE